MDDRFGTSAHLLVFSTTHNTPEDLQCRLRCRSKVGSCFLMMWESVRHSVFAGTTGVHVDTD